MLPAVDAHGGAGHEAAVLAGEEGHPAGDFLGHAEPADRDLGDDLLQHRCGHGGDHVGVDIARRDRVDCHPELRAFLRQRLGEAVDAGLGGGIVDLAVLPRLPVDRADVDDPAPAALAHAGEGRLGHVEAPAEVDAHDIVPVLEAHLVERAVAGDPGVVDDDVDGTELRLDRSAAGLRRLVIAHVPPPCRDAGRFGKGAGLFVIAGIIGDDRVALPLEPLADRLPDPARSSGDDRYPAHAILP